MSTVVEQEQRIERNPDYEEAEKQHYQSEEDLKLQLLKDRKKSLIDRRASIFEVETIESTNQSHFREETDREREQRIHLEKFSRNLILSLGKILNPKEKPLMKSGVMK